MISAAVQYWPSFLRATVWIATSWWLPLIASIICLMLWFFLSRREKRFAGVSFKDAIILPSERHDGTQILRHQGVADSRIKVRCGKDVEGCVVKDHRGIWYRA